VLTVLLTAFGRAVAEVGAVMIVGGNIDGVTRVMTTAIALETSKGDLPLALALGMVLLGVVGLLNGAIGLLPAREVQEAAMGGAWHERARLPPARRTRRGELITLQRRLVQLRRVKALQPLDLAVAPRRPPGADRRQRLGQDHAAAPAARPAAAQQRQRRVHALQGRAPRMAMLFQRPFLLHLSVRRNLRLALWLAGVPGSERAERM
jgi:tungstate transport system ATP-binding protein